jgi:hypothetical protein
VCLHKSEGCGKFVDLCARRRETGKKQRAALANGLPLPKSDDFEKSGMKMKLEDRIKWLTSSEKRVLMAQYQVFAGVTKDSTPTEVLMKLEGVQLMHALIMVQSLVA